MSKDPRKGLHRNLNLFEAYQVYEKDFPRYSLRVCSIGLAGISQRPQRQRQKALHILL